MGAGTGGATSSQTTSTTPPPSVTTPPADPNAAVYGGATPVPTSSSGGAVLPGAGAVPTAGSPDTSTMPGLDPSLSGVDYQENIHGSPAVPKGAHKGEKDGDLTRISDLVKIAATLSMKGDPTNLNSATLADVYKQAGVKMPSGGAASILGDVADTLAPHGAHFIGHYFEKTPLSDADRLKIVQATIKDLHGHLERVGIPSGPGLFNVPKNLADAHHEVAQLGNVPLDPTTLNRLSRQGYNIDRIKSVRDLVSQQDTLAAGAPGSPGSSATVGSPGPVPASQVYRDFQKGMGDAAQRTAYVDELSATGYLDTTTTAPTDQQVAEAYQKMMDAASKAGTDPASFLAKQINASGATESVDLAYVNHVAAQIGVTLSPTTAQGIANQIGTAGTTGAYTDDRVWAEVGSHYDYNQQGGAGSQTGFAAFAEQNIRQEYANEGVAITDNQAAALTQQVITGKDPKTGQVGGGPTSIYQVGDTASAQANELARQQAIQLHPYFADQLKQGTTYKTLMDPYLQTAANTLGVGVSDINLTDPKWSPGSDTGQALTPAQYATKLMTDPQYGYTSSQPAKATAAAGAAGLLQLFGKMPSGNPFGSTASTSTVANQ